MELTEEDRVALYNSWMSQKAKMHITQMEMAKKLSLSQVEFSDFIRGSSPLSMGFVTQFCRLMRVEPTQVLPSLHPRQLGGKQQILLKNRVVVDGVIQNVYQEGNQVIIEYSHAIEE